MKPVNSASILYIAFFIVFFSLSGCISFSATQIPEQEYVAIAGIAPKLDGVLDDTVWKGARWDHDYVLAGRPVANGDTIGCHFNFALCANAKFIFLAVEIVDEMLVYADHSGHNSLMDDSLDICIDPLVERSTSYDPNDSLIRISASAIGKQEAEWGDVQKGMLADYSGSGDWSGLKVKAVAIETNKGWNVEAAIPLENESFSILMKDGLLIGFNILYNDNDNGVGRDRVIGWSKKKDWQESAVNASVFGTVKFAGEVITEKQQTDKASNSIKNQEPAAKKIIQGRVLEYISKTKKVVIQIGSSTPGIKIGLKGKIFNDAQKTQDNGTIELTKIFPSYSEGIIRNQIIELNLKSNEVIAVFEVEE